MRLKGRYKNIFRFRKATLERIIAFQNIEKHFDEIKGKINKIMKQEVIINKKVFISNRLRAIRKLSSIPAKEQSSFEVSKS